LIVLLISAEMIPLLALFSGEPPLGMPHVNPTVETWGAGDYTKVFPPFQQSFITVLFAVAYIFPNIRT
jgi:hypothetical protein